MDDPPLPLVFTRSQAILLGLTRHAVTWRVRSGRWHQLRPGAFCTAQTWADATVDQRHLLVALAAMAGPHRRETVSHLTAALAYGWPGPIEPPAEPWFTIDRQERVCTRRRSGVVRQVAPLPAGHDRQIGSLTISAPARTVADCLRHLPAEDSLPIADAAIRAGVSLYEVERVLRWQTLWPYAARGAATLELVNGRRENWLESRSAVTHHRLGQPPAEPQVDIFDSRGVHVGRVDFLWLDAGVIGESDGWDKYRARSGVRRLEAAPDLMSAGALREEKIREDRLRDLGYEMVRWSTADALHPGRGLADRLRRAFLRADPSRIIGSARPSAVPVMQPLRAEGLLGLAELARGRDLMLGVQPYSDSAGDRAS
jgi:hypothetical protein